MFMRDVSLGSIAVNSLNPRPQDFPNLEEFHVNPNRRPLHGYRQRWS